MAYKSRWGSISAIGATLATGLSLCDCDRADPPPFGVTQAALGAPFCVSTTFNGTTLDPRWHWLSNAYSVPPTVWNVGQTTPGQLFIQANAQTEFYTGPGNGDLLYQALSGDFDVEAQFAASPAKSYQKAGIFLYQDENNFFGAYEYDYPPASFRTTATVGGAANDGTSTIFRYSTCCVRLSRSGTTITSYRSSDCATFTLDRTYAGAYSSWILLGVSVDDGLSGATFSADVAYVNAPAEVPGTTCTASYPSGAITLTPTPQGIPADGVSVSTVTSGSLVDATGVPVPDGTPYSVQLTPIGLGASVNATDLLPALPGTQITSTSGTLAFPVQAGVVPGTLTVTVSAVNGDATGSTTIILTGLPADGGAADGGASDASTSDAGAADAGSPDAAPSDAGGPDGGLPDAGAVDAAVGVDAGANDASALDSGGPADASGGDAGLPSDGSSSAADGSASDGAGGDAGVLTDGGPGDAAEPGDASSDGAIPPDAGTPADAGAAAPDAALPDGGTGDAAPLPSFSVGCGCQTANPEASLAFAVVFSFSLSGRRRFLRKRR